MHDREPRRYLLAVEVGAYEDSLTWPPISETERELAEVVDLLTSDRFRYSRILEDVSKAPQEGVLSHALSKWCREAGRQPDDHLIVYWTGHGIVHNESLHLALPATRDREGLDFCELVKAILGENVPARPVLFLLDVCFAGQGIVDVAGLWGKLTRLHSAADTPELGLICATGGRDPARPLEFADAFVAAIESSIDPNKRLPPALALPDIQRKIQAQLGRKVQIPFFFAGHSELLFFRNPYRIAHWPRDVDAATESQLALIDSVARGVPTAASVGWFFKGRKQVFADLCRWLQPGQPAGLCRLRGGMGTGKSAVLARLYTLSRADYRAHVPPAALAETELPPAGSIDGMILLHRKSNNEVFIEIVQKLRIPATTTDQLTAALKKFPRTPALVFDGLDEADRPNKTLSLLQTLAQSAKVIVGDRLTREFPADLEINLDLPRWSDPGAVEVYVAERLGNEIGNCPAAARVWQHDFIAAVRKVVEHAQRNFLLASLSVTGIINNRMVDDPTGTDWRFPETVGEAFDQLLYRSVRDEDAEQDVRDMLLPLAYAEGNGMPKGELWRALSCVLSGRDHSRASMDDVFKKVPWFIRENLADGASVFRLFHIALTKHLQNGHDAQGVHGRITEVLQACLKRADRGELVGCDDEAYARRYLAPHLRRSGCWQALGRLVMTPDWIGRKTVRPIPFERADLASDMDQAREAACEANTRAAQRDQALPALAQTAWWMVWRSAQVTLIERTPPAAWPLLVKAKEMSPIDVLHVLASIGDETVLTSRLEALAHVLAGADLDRLLDLAEGIELPQADREGAPRPVRNRDKPLELYETILQNALSGPDGKRLAQRALDSAARVPDEYKRWRVLTAAMTHFDTSQLAEAKRLLDATAPGSWTSLARASYRAERARRGDEHAVQDAKRLPRDTLAWWFSAAALFALEKETKRAVLESPRLTDEIIRASESIDDFYQRLEVMTALIQALPAVELRDQRAALAVFLRRLHGCTRIDSVVRRAALAGQHLPSRHGARLLRWARFKLLLARRINDANFNWWHSPPGLAQAFASTGDLASALDVVQYTVGHDYARPRAYDQVARAFRSATPKTGEASVDMESLLDSTRSSDMRSQFLCAHACAFDEAGRPDIAGLLGTMHIALDDDLRLVRCGVAAERARDCNVNEIAVLLRQFLSLDPPDSMRERFAANCAAGGHVREALSLLASSEPHQARFWWAATLTAASAGCRFHLLQELKKDASLMQAMLEYHTDVLIDIGWHANAQLLHVLSEVVVGFRYPWHRHCADSLKDVLAVRAFEINERALAQTLLDEREVSLSLLHASRRLQLQDRRAFIELMNETCLHPARSDTLHALLARHLSLDVADIKADSLNVVDAIIAEPDLDDDYWLSQRMLELFDGKARERLLSFAFEARIAASRAGIFHLIYDFGWMLPWMNRKQLARLLKKVRSFPDDAHRDEGIVFILPHFARRYGWKSARELRGLVKRSDFQGSSWAALWTYLPEPERADAFAQLIPDRMWRDGSEAKGLAKLAPHLSEIQLAKAIRWMIAHYRDINLDHVDPLVEAARHKQRQQALAIWDAIVTGAARLPCADAMEWLGRALPLAERLGGAQGLAEIDAMLARAAAQWPADPMKKAAQARPGT